MARGFVYLTAVADRASHRVLVHRVATTLEAGHVVAALEEPSTLNSGKTVHTNGITSTNAPVKGQTRRLRGRIPSSAHHSPVVV
jgi:hypothetical protein